MKVTPACQSLAEALRCIPVHPRHSLYSRFSNSFQCQTSYLFRTSFSTTPQPHARNAKGPKKDPRITLIRYHLHHPLTPRPLRFSRLRSLRHWTIHRAAQLVLHRDRALREAQLERQYNAMRAACEELRLGVGDGGRLYRQAVTRKGIYGGMKVAEGGGVAGNGGMPIEYARAQTEGPPREGWDHEWKRG